MSLQSCQKPATLWFPEFHLAIEATGSKETTIARPVDPPHPTQMPLKRDDAGPIREAPHADLSIEGTRCDMSAVRAEDDGKGAVECLGERAFDQLGACKACILRVIFPKIRLSDEQMRQVKSAQIAPEQTQELDQVGR